MKQNDDTYLVQRRVKTYFDHDKERECTETTYVVKFNAKGLPWWSVFNPVYSDLASQKFVLGEFKTLEGANNYKRFLGKFDKEDKAWRK